MGTPPSDCAKKRKQSIKDYLEALAVGALKSAWTAAIHTIGQLLCALANALLAELQPFFALEKVVVEDFVIFPLNAIKSTISGVTTAIAAPVNSIADNNCSQHGKVIKNLQIYANKAKVLSNKYGNMSDSATKWLKSMDDEIQGWKVACDVLGTDLQAV